MQIYGPVSVHGPQPISSPHGVRTPAAPQASSPAAASDELAISEVGSLVDQVRQLPDIRAQRVAEIRAAIADGTYETDDKLEAAVGRLAEEIL